MGLQESLTLRKSRTIMNQENGHNVNKEILLKEGERAVLLLLLTFSIDHFLCSCLRQEVENDVMSMCFLVIVLLNLLRN